MIRKKLSLIGITPEQIINVINELNRDCPKAEMVISDILAYLPKRGKQEVYPYQAMVLYYLAKQYFGDDTTMLDIGTYWGFTALVLLHAAPTAKIYSLNPIPWEWEVVHEALGPKYKGRLVLFCTTSQKYLSTYAGPELDLIFVDGDHKRIREDIYWYNWLKIGGLILFHDYSPSGSKRPCLPVYHTLFLLGNIRAPDISVIDNEGVGMVGWYKQSGEHITEGGLVHAKSVLYGG